MLQPYQVDINPPETFNVLLEFFLLRIPVAIALLTLEGMHTRPWQIECKCVYCCLFVDVLKTTIVLMANEQNNPVWNRL